MIYTKLPGAVHVTDPHCIGTPEGGVLFIGHKTVTYIGPILDKNVVPEVRVVHTRQFIKSIDLDPSWGQDDQVGGTRRKQKAGKFFAIAADDKTVQVWDIELGRAVYAHNGHVDIVRQYEGDNKDLKRVLLSYMSNRNLLSIDNNEMIVYCVASNSYARKPSFIRQQHITVLKCSPFNENIFAVGTIRGLVLVCDLQTMQIRYTLRGHHFNSAIVALVWHPVLKRKAHCGADAKREPIVMYLKDGQMVMVAKEEEPVVMEAREESLVLSPIESPTKDNDELFDRYRLDPLDSEFGVPARCRPISKSWKKTPPFVGIEKPPAPHAKTDFATACNRMHRDLTLLKLKSDDSDKHLKDEITDDDLTLPKIASPPNSPQKDEDSSRINVIHSPDDSLEVLQYSSSDDADFVDGNERKPKHQVLHHIYHRAEVHNLTESLAAAAMDVSSSASPEAVGMVDSNLGDGAKSISSADTTESAGDYDILLLSASDDSSTWLWNTLNGSICEYKPRRNHSKGAGKYTCLAWLDERTVLVNYKPNELSVWQLERRTTYNCYTLKEIPERSLKLTGVTAFTVCPRTQLVWIITKNRKVTLADLQTNEIRAEYGNASSARTIIECPDDMNKIALGLSDRRLGIFDISKVTPQRIAIDSFMPVADTITSMAWSPDSTKVAYGTKDGKVGVFNIDNGKHIVTIKQMYTTQIYSMVWHEEYIYYICNQTLYAFDIEWQKSEAYIVQEVDRVTAINMRGNFLIAGTVDGQLHLYRRESCDQLRFERLQRLILFPRYITQIAWNPLLSDTLAVVGNDNLIFVVYLNKKLGDLEVKQKLKTPMNDEKRALISSVKWSNYNENMLLTCGCQGNVCVWDLTKPDKPIVSKDYNCPMFCAIFLPSNENIVMCSGKTLSIEFFNIQKELQRKGTEPLPPNPLHQLLWGTRAISQAMSAAEKKRAKNAAKRVAKRAKEQSKYIAAPLILHDMAMAASFHIDRDPNILKESSAASSSACATGNKRSNGGDFMTHSSTLLYLVKKEVNKEALEKIAIMLSGDAKKIQESVHSSKLFSTNYAAKELLEKELNNHKGSDTRNIASICLTQINLTLKDEIIERMQSKTLSEFHVALAPSIDYKFWQKCIDAFAEQLAEQGHIMQSAAYWMGAHKKRQAIDMLFEKKYFKEALLFARVYLPSNESVQDEIVTEWVDSLERDGNLTGAAFICVLANEMMRAHRILQKIRTPTEQIFELLNLIHKNGDLKSMENEKKAKARKASNSESVTDANCETPSASENITSSENISPSENISESDNLSESK